MQQYRFYLFLIAFLVGVATATVWSVSLPVIVWVLVVAFGIMVVWRRAIGTTTAPLLFTTSIVLVCLALGMLRLEVAAWEFGHSVLSQSVGKDITLEGTVIQEPEQRERTTQLYVETSEGVVLVSTDRYATVSYGDTVTVEGVLKKPESFTTDLGRTFDYPAYLLVRGVEYQLAFASVQVQDSGQGNFILATLFSIKQSLIEALESVLPEPYSGLGQGLLLGVKQAIGEDLESAFRTSGIIHIVVLSGYNVMLVVTFVLFVSSFFLPRNARIIFGLLAITAFALLVGLSATVVRASIMASLLLFADLIGRRYDLGRALLLAATIMVFLNPYLLVYDIGFQLSFMATLGLILVAPVFESFITDGFSKLSIKDFFISTVATQIAVLPLLMYHIGEVSLVAIVVNVLVLPVVPLAMLLTFFTSLVALLSTTLALPLSFLAYGSLAYIITVAQLFATLPLASVIVPEISPWFMFGMYGLMGYGLYVFKQRRRSKEHETDNWVIEEEVEKAPEGLRPSGAQTEIPIFFR